MFQSYRGFKRFAFIVAGFLTLGLGVHIHAQADREDDHNALRAIKASYEDALNHGNFDALMPYLAADLSATMATGEKVSSPSQFRAYFAKMKNLMKIGNGGAYSVKVEPFATDFTGAGSAVSFGTTDESLQLPGGQAREYHSYWVITARKEGAQWKLTGGRMVVDPHNTTFTADEIKQISGLAQAAGKAVPQKKGGR